MPESIETTLIIAALILLLATVFHAYRQNLPRALRQPASLWLLCFLVGSCELQTLYLAEFQDIPLDTWNWVGLILVVVFIAGGALLDESMLRRGWLDHPVSTACGRRIVRTSRH